MSMENPASSLLLSEEDDLSTDCVAIDSTDLDEALVDFSKLSLDAPKLEDSPNFAYPALLLCNVGFQDVLRVLKAYRKESYRAVDVWVSIDDTYSCSGTMQLTSDVLLLLKRLCVKVIAYWDAEHTEVLDLGDSRTLEKFI